MLAELAIEEFTANPTVKTITEISFPLIKAAEFRTMQDAKGVNDLSVGDAYALLKYAYIPELDKLCVEKLGKEISEIVSANIATVQKCVQEKVTEIAKLTLSETLPSSKWVAAHGLRAFFENTFYPTEEANKIKKEFAKFYIENKQIKAS